MKHIVVEYLDTKPTAVHVVVLPDVGDKFFSQQIKALEAFRKHVQSYTQAYVTQSIRIRIPIKRFTIYSYEGDFTEWVAGYDRVYPEGSNPIDNLPVRKHDSIWAFFNAVGYLRRKRRIEGWPDLRRGRKMAHY